MVAGIVNSWNALATAQRNIAVGEAAVASAYVLDEGMFEEYRAGLRSTFDVLFAHGSLRDAQISLINARHDLYVAEASLLRRIGMLEAGALLTGTGLYDPDDNFRKAKSRANLPWDAGIRAIDGVGGVPAKQNGIEQPPLGPMAPALVPGAASAPAEPARNVPNIPLPGTTGTPKPDRSIRRP